MERVILHCDLNSFYASVELLDHPELQHLPVAVGGDKSSRHGVILAKNDHAKKFRVQTGEAIWQSKQKCPNLVILPAHHEKYTYWSQRVNEIYGDYTDLVEPFGVDESWLDVTGSLHLFGNDAVKLADEIRHRVQRDTGLTISVGVSFNKVFSKLGSDYKKPNATTYIPRERVTEIVHPLPVGDLLYAGRASQVTMKKFGIHTIGDLAGFDRDTLVILMGKQGAMLHDYATGVDGSAVAKMGDRPPPKSVGNGHTFAQNLEGEDQVRSGIAMLTDDVAGRLRKHGMKCGGISLTIRDVNLHDQSRQQRIEPATWIGREIAQAAMQLAIANWNMSNPIRALTVTAISLRPASEAGEQFGFFEADNTQQREKLEGLDRAIDQIREKYGKGAISVASSRKQTKED